MARRKPKALKTMGAPENSKTLISLFSSLPDPRIERTKAYPLSEILFLVLVATISGINHLTRIQQFGETKLDWLRTNLPYANGVPSHDTIGRVLAKLDADALEMMFLSWMNEAAEKIDGVIAVDGKTLRGAVRRGEKRSFIHMVSAFSAANGLVMAQIKAEEKSNEITAIPRLLELLRLEGAIVTIDAAGCQVAIIEKIVERGGDFIIAAKGNQETLHEDIGIAFHDADNRGGDSFTSSHETEELANGRGEWRKCEVISAAGIISDAAKWPSVRTLIRVTTERRLDVTTPPVPHTRYYISSLANLDAEAALKFVRAHWSVENGLHWHLDVTFREDDCRVNAENAAENLAVIRHMALNLLRSVEGLPKSLGTRRELACYSDAAREKILAAEFN